MSVLVAEHGALFMRPLAPFPELNTPSPECDLRRWWTSGRGARAAPAGKDAIRDSKLVPFFSAGHELAQGPSLQNEIPTAVDDAAVRLTYVPPAWTPCKEQRLPSAAVYT